MPVMQMDYGRPVQVIQTSPDGQQYVYHGMLKSSSFDSGGYQEIVVAVNREVGFNTPDDAEITLRRFTRPPGKGKGKKTRAEFIRDLTDKISVTEDNMEKFHTTVIRNPRTRSVTVHVEDKDGKFLLADGTRQERALNAEMPAYATFPEEVWNSFASATVENEVGV